MNAKLEKRLTPVISAIKYMLHREPQILEAFHDSLYPSKKGESLKNFSDLPATSQQIIFAAEDVVREAQDEGVPYAQVIQAQIERADALQKSEVKL